MTPRADAFRAFRDELIPDTVANAARIPFYRELWQGVDLDAIRTVADLVALPLVDKQSYRAGFERRLPYGTPLAGIGHTTGTTGELVFRHRSVEEVEEQHAFLRAAVDHARDPAAPLPLVVVLGAPGHGIATGPPMYGIPIYATLDDAHRVSQVVQILTRSYGIPGYTDRVVEVQSSPDEIEVLTLALRGAGVEPRELGVRQFTLVSAYTSAAFREMVREVWGEDVRVVDRYSLSEVIGGATYFTDCGAFHPDPHVGVELLDPVTREPAGAGSVAVPVLTELYPLVRYQPLIRYWTNDVAERRDCPDDPLAFRVHGRLSDTPLRRTEAGTEVLCSAARLQDYLCSLPEVARATLADRLPNVPPVRVGPALVRVAHEPAEGLITLTVGVTYDPALYPAARRALAGAIEQRVYADNPPLARAAEAAEYRLRIVLEPAGWR